MKELKGNITIYIDGDGARIEIGDTNASSVIMKIEMSAKDFLAALGRQAYLPIDMKVYNLDRIGKVHEHRNFEFEMPEKSDFMRDKETAERIASEKCPEGWTPDLHFSSQNSFFKKDGKNYARCIIRRYVDPTPIN